MIHLIENYYAIPNNMGFTLSKDKGRRDKDGAPIYETIGYCGDLEETVLLLKRKVVGERLSDGLYELSEACEVIRETTDEIKQEIKSATK